MNPLNGFAEQSRYGKRRYFHAFYRRAVDRISRHQLVNT